MGKFVELTKTVTSLPVWINSDHIMHLEPVYGTNPVGANTIVSLTDNKGLYVNETIEEIIKKTRGRYGDI